MKKSILKVLLLILLPLLAFVPAMAQFDNAFQSTSTMAGSGSQYASDPMLGNDGMASYSTAINHTGRTGEVGEEEEEPDPNGDPDTPIGSALPALLLLAGAYTAVIALRRRKQA